MALRSVPRAALALPPAWRRRIGAALAVAFVLAAGYWLWFRDSSFARAKEVYVTGVDGPQARAIRSALEDAGLGMSTLHVRQGDLRDAVADYPVVRSVTAQGDFPHKLTIEVELNLPVAIIDSSTGRKPVAADGLLLPDVPIAAGLPVITTKSALPTERVTEGRAFWLVRVVGLAPEPLRKRLTKVIIDPKLGIVAQISKGPELRFGDASRLAAKWMAAARVLAAAGARGASYIDLRLPERPAAGGLPTTSVLPLAPAGEAAAPTTATATTPAPAPTSGVVENPQPQVQTSTQPSTQP
ncbi:MAG TPA: cell division protein FtsQ/DivIB [Gemmatimonadales bacterium]|nr:cell division protein FtsQ/DivIB [Gemmatimonadales bacterium]